MNTLSRDCEEYIYIGIDHQKRNGSGTYIVKDNEWPEYLKMMNDILFLIGYYP